MRDSRERLYRRKRFRRKRRIKKAISMLILIGLVLLLIGASFMTSSKAVAYDYQTCGTLWELAERNCPADMDKRRYIAEVMELNSMEDCTVYAGRLYQVPMYE